MDKEAKDLTYQLQCLVLYYWTLPPGMTVGAEQPFGWHYLTVTSIGLDHGLWANTPALVWLVLSSNPLSLSDFLSAFPSLLYLLSVHLKQQLHPSVDLPLALLSFPSLIFTICEIASSHSIPSTRRSFSFRRQCFPFMRCTTRALASTIIIPLPPLKQTVWGHTNTLPHWLCSCMALYFCLLNIRT